MSIRRRGWKAPAFLAACVLLLFTFRFNVGEEQSQPLVSSGDEVAPKQTRQTSGDESDKGVLPDRIPKDHPASDPLPMKFGKPEAVGRKRIDYVEIARLSRSPREAVRYQAIEALRGLRTRQAREILISILVNEDARRKEESIRYNSEKGGELWFIWTIPPFKHDVWGDAGWMLLTWNADDALREAYRRLLPEQEGTRRFLLRLLSNFKGDENRRIMLSVLNRAIDQGVTVYDPMIMRRDEDRHPLLREAADGLIHNPGPGVRKRVVRLLETAEQHLDDKLVNLLFIALEQYRDKETVRAMAQLAHKSPRYACAVAHLLRDFDLPGSEALLASLSSNEDAIVARNARESLKQLRSKKKKKK